MRNGFKASLYLIGMFTLIGILITAFKSDMARKGLRGSVRSITEYCASIHIEKGDTILGKMNLSVIVEFDKRGNKTQEKTFFKGDTIPAIFTKSQFDSLGKLICTIDYQRSRRPSSDTKAYYEMDSKGNVLVSKVYKIGDSSLDYILQYEYDGNENILKREHHFPKDSHFVKSVFYYDPHGNQVLDSTFGPDGLASWVKHSEYNSTGDVIREIGFTRTWEVKEIDNQYSYEYDNHRNWIKQYKWKAGELQSLIVRRIEYY